MKTKTRSTVFHVLSLFGLLLASSPATVFAGNSAADLSASVQSSPPSVVAGANVSLIALATNAGPGLAFAPVVLQVSLPNGTLGNRFVFQSASGAGWTCTHNGGSNQVNCTGSSPLGIGPSAPVTILARTPTVAGTYLTRAVVSSQSPDNNPANNASSVDTQVLAPPNADLSVALNAPATAELGATINGSATITNGGPAEAASHEIRLTFPTFLSNVTVNGGGYSCSGGSGVFTCVSSAPFAPSSVRTISFSGRAAAGGIGTLQVEARNCSCVDPNSGNNLATRSLTVFGTAPSVQLTKTASAATVTVGAEFTFNVSVRNNDTRAAQGIVVNDTLPTNASFLGTTTSGGFVCSGSGQLSCSIPSALAPGASANVLIRMRAPNSNATISNTAQMVIGDYGLVASATASINAIQPNFVDLAATKSASVSQIRRGQLMGFDLGVSNAAGAATATGVRIVDTLPEGFSFESASGSNWSCTGSNVVTCLFATSLGAAASSAVSISVRIADTAVLGLRTNSIRVSALEPEVNLGNNVSTAQVSVVDVDATLSSDLSAGAQFSAATARADDRLSINLILSNLGTGPVPAGALISGVLPAELLANSAPSGCQIAAQTVSCTAAAAIAPAGSVNFSVPITVASNLTGLPRNVSANFNASSSGADSNPSNNLAQATLRLESAVVNPPATADLALSLSPGSITVAPAATTPLTATVNNLGPAASAGVRLAVTLPAGFALASSAGGLQCSSGAPVVCTLASLAANTTAAVTLNLTASSVVGSYSIAAAVTATTQDNSLANNNQTATVVVQAAAGGGNLGTILAPLVDDPVARAALAPIAAGCARSDFSLRDVCDALSDAARRGDRTAIEDTLRAIAPEEVLVQARAVNEIGIAQFQNVDARMSELRGGGGGFSASNLTFISGNEVIPVGMLAALVASASDDPADGTADGLVSPWGFFINGVIQRGSRDPSQQETGFDFNTHALTLGVDYRFSNKLAAGAAFGSSKFSSDYGGGGVLDTRALTFTGYASYYYSDTAYVDSRLSFGRADFDQVRPINIRIGALSQSLLAAGQTNADQLTAAFATGRHFQVDRFNITPNASLRFLRTNIDAFTETGAGRFGLSYADQSIDSLTFTGGVSASRPISTTRGVFTPQFDLNLHHEFRNNGMAVEARLIGQRPDEIFFLRGDAPDRDYASAGLGLVYVGAQGRQAYLTWRTLFGLDKTERNTINLGARFEF